MRKVLLIAILILGGVFYNNASAQTPCDITLQIINKGVLNGGNPKTPTLPLVITQTGNVLTLPGFADDITLQLLDDDGYVVYSLFIPAGTTQVVLPTTLTGDFEIRFVADDYYYYGFISL